jgi:CubicO group peptidase (beta-lactamase class C family)
MAFTCFNRNIRDEAHDKIRALGPSGVQAFAFTPSGGWVIVANGGLFARNIPEECYQKLLEFVGAGHKIRVIAFPPEGGNRWLIVTDRTYFARNIPDECYDRLGVMWNAGARPTCVAFPPPGGNRWAILAGKSLYCRNIDDECYQLLANFAQGLRPAVRVAFTPQNGWVILARDRFFARRIPDECYDKMRELGQSWEIDHVNFEFDGGWSIISNTGRTALANDLLRELEGRIIQIGGDWKSITERMAAYKVPGVTVALVKNNQIWWATTYGRVEAGGADWVHADTVFQAASCSKPVAAIGFLRLVQSNLIGLDESVPAKLEWNLPRRSCAPASWEPQVTLRRLLQHRGGIIGRNATNPTTSCSNFDEGGGGGFGGYENASGVGVPTTVEVLNGTSSRPGVNVNSHAVKLVYDPDSMGAYSGEGFTLMQQLLEEQRGMSLRSWMAAHVLAPAGMTRSTFSLTAPTYSGPPASGHLDDGTVIAGKRYRHPESAAAGLYTTATDLARFVIAINQGGVVGSQTIIDSTRFQAMLTNSLGMPFSNQGTDDEQFGHGGSNRGFRCTFKGFPKKKAGYAIMTNGDNGGDLQGEIAAAIVRTYGWE